MREPFEKTLYAVLKLVIPTQFLFLLFTQPTQSTQYSAQSHAPSDLVKGKFLLYLFHSVASVFPNKIRSYFSSTVILYAVAGAIVNQTDRQRGSVLPRENELV